MAPIGCAWVFADVHVQVGVSRRVGRHVSMWACGRWCGWVYAGRCGCAQVCAGVRRYVCVHIYA